MILGKVYFPIGSKPIGVTSEVWIEIIFEQKITNKNFPKGHFQRRLNHLKSYEVLALKSVYPCITMSSLAIF